jgi:hypothetical protein
LALPLLPVGVAHAGSSWSVLSASLNTERVGLAAATAPCPKPSIDTCLYAIGGQDYYDNVLSSVEYYSPTSPTAALIASFAASRRGGSVHFRWQVPRPAGVIGFALYAGRHRLTSRLIPVHRSGSPVYRYVAHHAPLGPYSLMVILANGARQVAASSG